MTIRRVFLFLGSAAALGLDPLQPPPPAAAAEIVRFEDLQDEALESQAFSVRRPVALHVVCEGAGDGDDEDMYAYGWILDRKTRQVVWSLSPQRSQQRKERNYVFDGDVRLPEGEYVAYYAAYGNWRSRQKVIKFLGKEVYRFEIDNDRYKRRQRDAKSWGLRVETRTESDAAAVESNVPEAKDPRTIVQLIGLEDDQAEQQGFRLDERMQVTIYCLGEFAGDSMADDGWIIDAATRKRVWALGPNNFKHAGGAAKNKVARETITLPAGNYLVYYSCDGSHSSGAWNAPPPYDPDFWGITVWAATPDQARKVRPYQDEGTDRGLVSLIEQGNDAYNTQGFTLTKPVQVRVYALGEFAHGGFADEGWIENFSNHRRVWEMTEHNTEHAGGAEKNRMADDVVDLPAGDYVLYYKTDDSHAYPDWNGPRPHDPSRWGITVYPVAKSFDRSSLRIFDPEKKYESGKQFLVRLIKVGDDADEEQEFKLDRATKVRVVSLGEGVEGDTMYDYGWIENAETGRTIWEMTVRNSRRAGGAEKNRIFDDLVLLDKGRYIAHYVSDGSHAWMTWNHTPPPQPYLWGITVMVETANP